MLLHLSSAHCEIRGHAEENVWESVKVVDRRYNANIRDYEYRLLLLNNAEETVEARARDFAVVFASFTLFRFLLAVVGLSELVSRSQEIQVAHGRVWHAPLAAAAAAGKATQRRKKARAFDHAPRSQPRGCRRRSSDGFCDAASRRGAGGGAATLAARARLLRLAHVVVAAVVAAPGGGRAGQ